MSAQYLVRFDDVCSTMNWNIWEQVEEALVGAGIKPILAIVPDNQDPKLSAAQPNTTFWERVRVWQGRGWSIGLHGYQHLHLSSDGGILKLNSWGEFSGLPFEEQKSRLQRARDILEGEGVHPDLWIAPGHSFDANTLRALEEIGIQYLSDGFSLYPYQDSSGMMWVPQQLWHFRRMPFGVWTVCLHVNSWRAAEVDRFKSNIAEFGASLTDWHSVVSQYDGRKRSAMDRLFSRAFPAVQQARQRWAQIGLR